MAPLIDKYGFDADDTLPALATQRRAQQARGVSYFVGEALSSVDIYWMAVMNMILPLRPHSARSARRRGRP